MKSTLLACTALAAAATEARAVLAFTGVPYTQNFDTLATSGTNNTWSDNTTIPGWYANRVSYRGDYTGGSGALHSMGETSGPNLTERALGSIGSGTANNINYGFALRNDTGDTLTAFTLTYYGEQWRVGPSTTTTAAVENTLSFSWSLENVPVDLSSSSLAGSDVGPDNDPLFSPASALDFNSITDTNATTVGINQNGNDAANRLLITATIPVTWAPNQVLWLRWKDLDNAAGDHGLAIDDVTFTAVPEPAAGALGILAGLGLAVRRRR